MELAAFLPERIQESFLHPEGKKKKLSPIESFMDWVLAFCCLGLPTCSPTLLLQWISSRSWGPSPAWPRTTREHPGTAWATYEQAFRAKVAANPSTRWNRLDQEIWALATVASTSTTPFPQKRGSAWVTCNRWNEDKPCSVKNCRYMHACAVCFSPSHKGSACPSSAGKRARGSN